MRLVPITNAHQLGKNLVHRQVFYVHPTEQLLQLLPCDLDLHLRSFGCCCRRTKPGSTVMIISNKTLLLLHSHGPLTHFITGEKTSLFRRPPVLATPLHRRFVPYTISHYSSVLVMYLFFSFSFYVFLCLWTRFWTWRGVGYIYIYIHTKRERER